MEEKEYRLAPIFETPGLEDQLNSWHDKGYIYVGVLQNFLVFKKKKTKKD